MKNNVVASVGALLVASAIAFGGAANAQSFVPASGSFSVVSTAYLEVEQSTLLTTCNINGLGLTTSSASANGFTLSGGGLCGLVTFTSNWGIDAVSHALGNVRISNVTVNTTAGKCGDVTPGVIYGTLVNGVLTIPRQQIQGRSYLFGVPVADKPCYLEGEFTISPTITVV